MKFIMVLIAAFGLSLSACADEVKVDGTWKWTYKTKDGKDTEVAVRLKQEGEKLSGAYIARDGKETAIEEGKINGDEISFTVNREVEGNKMAFKYTGKVSGDQIAGKIFFGKDKPLPHEWEATRGK